MSLPKLFVCLMHVQEGLRLVRHIIIQSSLYEVVHHTKEVRPDGVNSAQDFKEISHLCFLYGAKEFQLLDKTHPALSMEDLK